MTAIPMSEFARYLPPSEWAAHIAWVRRTKSSIEIDSRRVIRYISDYEPCEVCGVPVVGVYRVQEGIRMVREVEYIKVPGRGERFSNGELGRTKGHEHECNGRSS